MQVDASALFEAAAKRSGVALERLTDAALGEYAIPTKEQLQEGTYVSDPKTYDGLTANVSSVLSYAAESSSRGFDDVIEECNESADLRMFMRAVLDILLDDPHTITAGSGYRLNVDKLIQIRRAI